MTEEKYKKELKKYLNYLPKDKVYEELNKYNDFKDLDPVLEANKIYAKYNLKHRITKNMSLKHAIEIIIDKAKTQDKEILKNLIKFFLYLLVLLIVIKIPFIYVRDMLSTMISALSSTENIYTIWGLSFEIMYAITTILIFIKLIKTKAIELTEKK